MKTEMTQHPVVVTQSRLISDLEEAADQAGWLGSAWYPKMPEGKIVKFLRQFPWVARYIHPDRISQVFVSGITPQMIDRQMRDDTCEVISCEYAYLLDHSGSLVSYMTEETVTSRKYGFFGPVKVEKKPLKVFGSVESCRTIRWKLDELGNEIDKIKFLLSFDDRTKTAIVYKRPEGADIWEWMKGQIEDVPGAE